MLGVDGYCGSEIPARKPLEVGSLSYHVQGFTLPETNIAPRNRPSEKGFLSSNH